MEINETKVELAVICVKEISVILMRERHTTTTGITRKLYIFEINFVLVGVDGGGVRKIILQIITVAWLR